MPSNRFPAYYDHCLRCREKGLDDVADFIHDTVKSNAWLRNDLDQRNEKYSRIRDALSKIANLKNNKEANQIARDALEEIS
jgi:hypothetical protein